MTGIKLAVVDDHTAIAAGVAADLALLIEFDGAVGRALTVGELIDQGRDFDIVLLDVSLSDDSEPADNVRRLVDQGWPTLLYTQERRPAMLVRCIQAGALGVIGKDEEMTCLAEAVTVVARGEDYLNADWAAIFESMLMNVPELTSREREVITLCASGLPMKSVSRRLGIREDTAKEYLSRLRAKYVVAGRPAPTLIDVYKRAVEDAYVPVPGQGLPFRPPPRRQ